MQTSRKRNQGDGKIHIEVDIYNVSMSHWLLCRESLSETKLLIEDAAVRKIDFTWVYI